MEKKQNKKMNKQKKKKKQNQMKKKMLVAWENYSIFPMFLRVLVNYLFFSLNIK
jgi:cytoskeletal protein RodZ